MVGAEGNARAGGIGRAGGRTGRRGGPRRVRKLSHVHEERIIVRVPDNERPNNMELFKCLSVVENLTTWDHVIQSFVLDTVLQELSTSVIHLKYFHFEDMGFAKDRGLPFLCKLIKCSPNLEKIKLEIDTEGFYIEPDKPEKVFVIFGKIFRYLPELEIVKFIVARSPNIKKATLQTRLENKDEKLEMLKILLCAPRASLVKIIIENHKDYAADD
ncbi:F-box/FBD/LRR-repeat protein At1g13570-like [Bidens hawaiensis]|uniref:F-box/FBD/LRR-repeat protein At1g13570-like n=1 Tax=Bidens hawaiensis TaxID=980011 RepID=UPI00404B4AC3